MLQVFKSLPVVRAVHHVDAIPVAAAGFAHDTLTLGWEERQRARGRRRSDSGAEFGTVLPRGTVLRGNDCLVVEELSLVVSIIERLERVFVIVPESPAQWATFAYHIGNSHQPLMVVDEALLCPDVLGVEQVLRYHGIAFTAGERAFTPMNVSGDLSVARHQHSPSADPRTSR